MWHRAENAKHLSNEFGRIFEHAVEDVNACYGFIERSNVIIINNTILIQCNNNTCKYEKRKIVVLTVGALYILILTST